MLSAYSHYVDLTFLEVILWVKGQVDCADVIAKCQRGVLALYMIFP